VAFQSDHPVLNSRYLLYEAQQAYYYGLPENLAIASVTSNSAEVMGMGHRIGYVKEGQNPSVEVRNFKLIHCPKQVMTQASRYYCVSEITTNTQVDLVIWDSHPLALGATPSQVFIDGIPQLGRAKVVRKPKSFQDLPHVPNFDDEARKAVQYEGLPPLSPRQTPIDSTIIFTNVASLYQRQNGSVREVVTSKSSTGHFSAHVRGGRIVCYGEDRICAKDFDGDSTVIDLEGGSLSPGLVSYGSPLGLENIAQEPSTNDGPVFDPLRKTVPSILGGDYSIVKAVDGLDFGTRDAL